MTNNSSIRNFAGINQPITLNREISDTSMTISRSSALLIKSRPKTQERQQVSKSRSKNRNNARLQSSMMHRTFNQTQMTSGSNAMNLNNSFQMDTATGGVNASAMPGGLHSLLSPQRTSIMRSSMKGAQNRHFSSFRTGQTTKADADMLTNLDVHHTQHTPGGRNRLEIANQIEEHQKDLEDSISMTT